MTKEEYIKQEEELISTFEKNGSHELAEKMRNDLEQFKKQSEANEKSFAETIEQITNLKKQIGEEKWNEIVKEAASEFNEEEARKLAEKYLIEK